MTDRTSLSLLKRTIPSCSFPENIVLGDIIQNLFNLRVNYPRRFLHVSILLISDCTLRLLKKLVKRKLQEELGDTDRTISDPASRSLTIEYSSTFLTLL